jgi:hypothetical protein
MRRIVLVTAMLLAACGGDPTETSRYDAANMPGVVWSASPSWTPTTGAGFAVLFDRTYATIGDTLAWWEAPADFFGDHGDGGWSLVVGNSVQCTEQHLPSACYSLTGHKIAVSVMQSSVADPVNCIEATDLGDVVAHALLGGDADHTDARWPAFRAWYAARIPADCR